MALTVKVNTTCYFKWLRQDWIDFRPSTEKHFHIYSISAFLYLYIFQVVPLETWVGDRLGLRTRCCHGSGKVEILRKKFSILQILYRFTPTWINWKHKFFFQFKRWFFWGWERRLETASFQTSLAWKYASSSIKAIKTIIVQFFASKYLYIFFGNIPH